MPGEGAGEGSPCTAGGCPSGGACTEAGRAVEAWGQWGVAGAPCGGGDGLVRFPQAGEPDEAPCASHPFGIGACRGPVGGDCRLCQPSCRLFGGGPRRGVGVGDGGVENDGPEGHGKQCFGSVCHPHLGQIGFG